MIFNCDTQEGRVYVNKLVREIVNALEGKSNSLQEILADKSTQLSLMNNFDWSIPKMAKNVETLEKVSPPLMSNKLCSKGF
jgi:hypothetical protein